MSGWTTPILHADLDAFYASVETIRNPELQGRPVIVGGTSNRGVVTSASYEARQFGVSSAMPTTRARRLCPEGIFISPDFEAYTEYSRRVRQVFDRFSPVVEPLSLDEAFLDLSGAKRLWETPADVAAELRRQVKRDTGLTVSVGIAASKFVAKIASSKAKPDGLLLVDPEEVERFLGPLAVGDLWGVGARTTEVLRRLGLRTIGQVAKISPETLESALGSLGRHIGRLAWGRDDRPVVPDPERQSVSSERTFEKDLVETEAMLKELLRLSDRVASRLRSQGISGQTITLKVRLANFTTLTRSKTLPHEVDGAIGIFQVVAALMARQLRASEVGRAGRVRLLGVSLSRLKPWPASHQLTFEAHPRWREADRALDRVRDRFGEDTLLFARLLEEES